MEEWSYRQKRRKTDIYHHSNLKKVQRRVSCWQRRPGLVLHRLLPLKAPWNVSSFCNKTKEDKLSHSLSHIIFHTEFNTHDITAVNKYLNQVFVLWNKLLQLCSQEKWLEKYRLPTRNGLEQWPIDLPRFGSHQAVLWRWTLTHHRGHLNLKVFGDVLYVGLSEAHSAWQQKKLGNCVLYINFK